MIRTSHSMQQITHHLITQQSVYTLLQTGCLSFHATKKSGINGPHTELSPTEKVSVPASILSLFTSYQWPHTCNILQCILRFDMQTAAVISILLRRHPGIYYANNCSEISTIKQVLLGAYNTGELCNQTTHNSLCQQKPY